MTSRPARGSSSAVASSGSALLPKRPTALAIAPNGDLLVIDRLRDQILERLPHGLFRVFAGSGMTGFAGDGGPAIDAELNQPSAMAVGPDGSVYLADTENNRIRRISPNGTISTVAGNGKGGWTRSGARALTAPIASPTALTFDRSGRLYIATGGWGEVLRLNRAGTLTRIAGIRGPEGIYRVGRPATGASVDGADGLAFDRGGNLYLAGFNTKTLLMIDRNGIMRAPLGTKVSFYPRGSGGLAPASNGHVLAIETQRIVQLGPHSERTLYTFRGKPVAGLTGFLPNGIAITGSGLVYTDTGYGNGWSSGSAIVTLKLTRRQAQTVWSHHGP